MNTIKFTRNLVKGRIAETIFSQMLRDAGVFTVLEFGYEKVIPELLQKEYDRDSTLIETLRVAPDFAVINQTSKEVSLVEVKYQRTLLPHYILGYAEKMHASWNPSHLFVATLDGFYFDDVTTIIENNGQIKPLEHPQIPAGMQNNYLQILRDFEEDN